MLTGMGFAPQRGAANPSVVGPRVAPPAGRSVGATVVRRPDASKAAPAPKVIGANGTGARVAPATIRPQARDGSGVFLAPPAPRAMKPPEAGAPRTAAQRRIDDKIAKVNAQLTEIRGYETAQRSGQLTIQPPGNPNAPGPDYIMFNPAGRGAVVVYDAKYRGAAGSYPRSIPGATLERWRPEVKAAIDALPEGPLEDAATEAWNAGRVEGRIFRGPHG
jgi:hypothetical protein